jgi:spore coat protein U-like protein
MICSKRLQACLAIALGGICIPAWPACGIANDPATLNFGPYTPITFPGKLTSATADSTGTISITCAGLTQPISYTLKASAGRSNYVALRSMGGTGGGADMVYNLYTDASRTTVWGDGASGTSFSGSIAPTDGPVSHTFYGRVPAGQSALRAGIFTDQLVITLEYSP